jgi:glucose/arabinose dehydrogenase
MYVTELHGSIKVVARDGTVSDYFNGALNYAPPLSFPGAGEQGLTGIAVDSGTGDVFASLMYAGDDGLHYPKIVRFKGAHGGSVAESSSLVIEFPMDPMGPSHQISNLSIGPDGMLYVHLGDGFNIPAAQNPDSARGKILRIATDGTAPADNPFYDETDGISVRDYVFALGFRNPFGGAWRAEDGAHYTVENGPLVDRFAKIVAGRNYLWDGSNASMTNHALYNWPLSTAPVNVAFMETDAFDGGGFPESKLGHAFVTESGATYAAGDTLRGKVITEFALDPDGNLVSGPTPLVEYTGTGRATVSGLAFGPDGLYFTDLYKDQDATGPTERGARVLVVKWVGE